MKSLIALLLGCAALQAQTAGGAPVINPDRTVDLRLRAPNAKEVLLGGEFGGPPQPLTRDETGVWTIRIGPLEPDIYGYFFTVDGQNFIDPLNPEVKTSDFWTQSLLTIPGGRPWEPRDVPHGTVHRHSYRSAAIGDIREFHVYTPPGYDARRRFPVLYLLHGAGDDSATWSGVGRANVILDNLIAERRAEPMIVVMPYGHAVRNGGNDGRARNIRMFEKDLLNGVLPLVEKMYAVEPGRAHRAIAGLSMGGGQALTIGLNHLERFSYVAGFSAAAGGDFNAQFPSLPKKAATVNERLRLLWIGCGKDDRLVELARRFHEELRERQIRHIFVESEGAHNWRVWRRYLCDLGEQLFR